MSAKKAVVVLFLFYFGCAAYKQLKPDPEISFTENGYIEITNDKDKFELSEGKKYFIKFPQPEYENTYLVLKSDANSFLNSYLTRAFDDGKGRIIKIGDVSSLQQKMSVYPIDKSVVLYYWVIDTVRQDVLLDFKYRYVPVWRFKFEQKKEESESILNQNKHNRSVYHAIGVTVPAATINYSSERALLLSEQQKLEDIYSSLKEIEQIFPEHIINSSDEAYRNYLTLKQNLEAEIKFQKNYMRALAVLSSASDPGQTIPSFLQQVPEYVSFLSDSSNHQANIITESQKIISARLLQLPVFLESELHNKKDIEKIPFDLQSIRQLYLATRQLPPPAIVSQQKFVTVFNQRAELLTSGRQELNKIVSAVENSGSWPADNYYTDRRVQLSKVNFNLPPTDLEPYGTYVSLTCVARLNQSILDFRSVITGQDAKYYRAEQLVAQINLLKNQNNYQDIIRLLRTNHDLPFLLFQYPDIDDLSLTRQKQFIVQSMQRQAWTEAESGIASLSRDNLFINPDKIEPVKNRIVKNYEDSLKATVEILSVGNANTLIDTHTSTVESIDSLYASPALYPVYKLTFTSGSLAELDRKNREIESKMNFLRSEKFPETAITALYREFSQNIQDEGVRKARAVVTHGKYYQGKDQKIKNLVAECDPAAAKWITKPINYRKIFVLPTTSNRSGVNQYLIRINLQIPSEAQFPVFDVNVKLPEEIARRAGSQQWYSEITFNKKVLKNEGRFSITAPTPENNYEVQITPLQVNKTGSNILEIRFTFAALKVFEVSIMAQKPIIKKN